MAGFGIPLFMVFMAVAVNISIWADPKRANIARSKELREITRWFIVVLAILMQAVIMLSGVGVKLNVRLVASVPTGWPVTSGRWAARPWWSAGLQVGAACSSA